MVRSSRVGVVVAVSVVATWLVLPVPAAHASISVEVKAGPRLEIVGDDAADTIVITCESTFVKVNGVDPDDGPFECGRISRIVVASHAGDDEVSLAGVDDEGFMHLDRTEIFGGADDDTLIGSQWYDDIAGQAGADTITGLGRYDEILIDADDALVSGGGGYDLVDLRADGAWDVHDASLERLGPDPASVPLTGIELVYLRGGPGADRFDATDFGGAVAMEGWRGDDVLIGGGTDANLQGGPGDDRLIGSNRRDTLLGGPGDDVLRGRSGPDLLHGDGGRDRLRGEAGDDRIDGGPGIDACFGGGGIDRRVSCGP